jgi:Xaa-Pro dipeptidase
LGSFDRRRNHHPLGTGPHRVGVERLNAGSTAALSELGLDLVDAQQPVERARAIKSSAEVDCVRASDYCETRLLNSGPRTNPWFQETASRVIQPNELIALDTDVIGCHGYYADFSRTFHVGPDAPTATQRDLYRVAHEQVNHNMAIIERGLTFAEYSQRAWNIPDRYRTNRYYLSAHGCGMTGEYPYLHHHAEYGDEGVKLEQQLLVNDTGIELLSNFPFEEALRET